jgi:hypothetical protein
MLKQNLMLWENHQPQINNLHEMMVKLFGVNVSSVSGINDYTLLRLVGETGSDMSRFPSVKHFVSWCGLAPGIIKVENIKGPKQCRVVRPVRYLKKLHKDWKTVKGLPLAAS